MKLGTLRGWLEKKSMEAGSQHSYAKKLGISGAYLSDVIHGKTVPGPKLLRALGLTKEVTYRLDDK
jgi:transcriptional regulator with XRE-family HTH domain